MDYTIVHNKKKKKFETTVEGHASELKYRIKEDTVFEFYHTGVPKELEGRGVGSALVWYALNYARQNNWKVNPVCPFVKGFMDRNPEWENLRII